MSRNEAYEDIIRDEESQDNQTQVQPQTQTPMSQTLTREQLIAQAESILNVLKQEPVTKVSAGITLNQELAVKLFDLGYQKALSQVETACDSHEIEVNVDTWAGDLQISGELLTDVPWHKIDRHIDYLSQTSREEEVWDMLVDEFGEEQLNDSNFLPKPATND